MAAPKHAPSKIAVAPLDSQPNMCKVQMDIGLTIPMTMEGVMVSMEPSSGAAQNAISIWTNIVAAIPTMHVTAKFQPN
ncbi:MAG TPA: hypothetical protein VJZ71_05790 [Phycisphaerae bacterium]|nr:hypothetical protein [Phycisphaerae bacterium]